MDLMVRLARGAWVLSLLTICAMGCTQSDDGDEHSEAGDPATDGRDDSLSPPFPPNSGGIDAGRASSAPRTEAERKTSRGDAGVPMPVSPFVDARKDAFSTFGADVDTASYDYLRQSLLTYQTLPRPDYVRAEDYLNYFRYDYPIPPADAADAFAISLAASAHPLGRPVTLLRVGIQAKAAPAEPPKQANLVFLVDVSGSMAEPTKLPLVQRLLTAALDVLAPTTKLSIVTYAGDTRVQLTPTLVSSRAAIERVVSGLAAGGGTNGASGLELAYEQAQAGLIAGGINHVVLCTDGDFNLGLTSHEALVSLIRQKRDTGITLTALGFGRSNLNDAMMEKVSNAGNGIYSLIYDADQAVEYANERLLATVVHVAKDMKIQVEFNVEKVVAYRLIGYENRAIADAEFRDDRVDGGEIGAAHRVTALYELVLAGATLPDVAGAPPLSAGEPGEGTAEIDPQELVRVKVRSKQVTESDRDPAREIRASLLPSDVQTSAQPDLAWAAAVSAFAELLRGSPYATMQEVESIRRIVREQTARDAERREFAQLLELAIPKLGVRATR